MEKEKPLFALRHSCRNEGEEPPRSLPPLSPLAAKLTTERKKREKEEITWSSVSGEKKRR